MITFVVPGKPQPKQSFRIHTGGWQYQPRTVSAYSRTVAIYARLAWPNPPLDGPVEIEAVAMFKKPKSWPLARRATAHKHAQRPDGDNLLKALADGVKGIVFNDDGQVSDWIIRKRWSDSCDELQVTIRPAQ